VSTDTPRSPLAVSSISPLVELQGVTKSYREGESERVVLSGVDLTLRTGDFAVLLGRSGSGKSTLLNLVSGMDTPTAGIVRLGGRSVHDLREDERTKLRRRSIGFVFQAFNLLPTLTVEQNVRLPLELNGRKPAEQSAAALGLLERVGLADRRRQYPDRLSGGEQQRVAIARALVHDPLLILADEPTGNLDDETGKVILSLLEELCRERRRTLLIATHDRAMVVRADRVLTLIHGHLVERPRLQVAP
jgi:putative ABC transport system ATP-binding protein